VRLAQKTLPRPVPSRVGGGEAEPAELSALMSQLRPIPVIDALGIISLFFNSLSRHFAVVVVLELVLQHEARLLVRHLAHLAQQSLYAILGHPVPALHQVRADLLQLGTSILLDVQVLDQLRLYAALVAVRRLDASRRALLLRLFIAELENADLHVIVGVHFVFALLDGLQVASGPGRQFDSRLHLVLLLLAQHEPALLVLLADAVGEDQVLGRADRIDLHDERLNTGAAFGRELEVVGLRGLLALGVVLDDEFAVVVGEIARQFVFIDRPEELLPRVVLQVHSIIESHPRSTSHHHLPK